MGKEIFDFKYCCDNWTTIRKLKGWCGSVLVFELRVCVRLWVQPQHRKKKRKFNFKL